MVFLGGCGWCHGGERLAVWRRVTRVAGSWGNGEGMKRGNGRGWVKKKKLGGCLGG